MIPTVTKHRLLGQAVLFTNAYKNHSNAHVAVREAMCLKTQFPAMLRDLASTDVFAGRGPKEKKLFFTPFLWATLPEQGTDGKQGGYCFDFNETRWNLTTPEEKETFEQLKAFWKTECSNGRCNAGWDGQMRQFIETKPRNIHGASAQALSGSNGCHIVLDYGKLMRLGIPGLFNLVRSRRNDCADAEKDTGLFDGMLIALELLVEVCRHYEKQARALSAAASNADVRSRMETIAGSLSVLVKRPPQTLHEALQLAWIYNVINADLCEFARFDVVFGDFYTHDIKSGKLTESRAEELLLALWKLMREEGLKVSDRVVVGGLGRKNEANADQLAVAVLKTLKIHRNVSPQFTLRLYKGQNPELLKLALDALADGCVFPLLYNDDVVVPGVGKSFGVNYETALRYHPFGCGEATIAAAAPSPVDAAVNVFKSLEAALHQGCDATGLKIGPVTEALERFDAFEALYAAFERQLEFALTLAAKAYKRVYDEHAEHCAFLYASMLADDCIERGLAAINGGLLFRGACIVGQGYTNAADSLNAVRQVVFEENICSLADLVKALDADFVGHEDLHRRLKAVPKFGNDDPLADKMFARVWNSVHDKARIAGRRVGLDYCVVSSVNPGGLDLGQKSGTGADGRKRGEVFAVGTAPAAGADKTGLTAMLNSLSCVSAANGGSTSNVKITREYLTRDREKFEAVLKVFFARGGQQLSVTSVCRDDLEQALKFPEKYAHILARVGGFTTRFVETSDLNKREILNRTLH